MKKFVNSMRVLLAASLFFASIFSCTSSAHFPIPGEKKVTQAALHAEYFLIADAYAELEKYDKAVQYYKLAMRDVNLYWSALYKLGRAYALLKNWAEAKDIYEKLLARDPQNMSLKLSLAYIQAMSGNFDEAKSAYENLIDEQRENETPLVNYIAILLSQEEIEASEAQLAILKERFPESTAISDFEKRIDDARKKQAEENETEELSANEQVVE
ncbi:MAG: tetratricopeptide repeat protein [Treponema sp.]|nr:tetratricopeptide repeat protein [Treponema sp.]